MLKRLTTSGNSSRHRRGHSRFVGLLILFVLLFNSVGAIFAASAVADSVKNYSSSDVELVCTGANFKWMSVSHYQKTGEILFVEAPKEAPQHSEQIKCSNQLLIDLKSSVGPINDLPEIGTISFTRSTREYLNAGYLHRKHQQYVSRAPPF